MNTLQQLTAVAARTTKQAKPKPPCAAHPDDWDLDVGTPDNWQEAVRSCLGCPILAQCRELAVTLTARGMPPRSMIWAGVGYDGTGAAIENLDRHRTRPIERKQPLHIVRTGPTYTRTADQAAPDSDTFTTSARRTIMLRRRSLPATGSVS
jgi:hypothetical protein